MGKTMFVLYKTAILIKKRDKQITFKSLILTLKWKKLFVFFIARSQSKSHTNTQKTQSKSMRSSFFSYLCIYITISMYLVVHRVCMYIRTFSSWGMLSFFIYPLLLLLLFQMVILCKDFLPLKTELSWVMRKIHQKKLL